MIKQFGIKFIFVPFLLLFAMVFVFNIQVFASAQIGMNASPEEFPKVIENASDLGIGIVRIPLDWQEVETSPDVFDWEETDGFVEIAQIEGVEILFTLRCISSWGTNVQTHGTPNTGYHSGAPPTNMSDWADFVSQLATRYKGKGVRYEIENEVNAPAFWSGTVDDYVSLLQTSYQTIKSVDPQAIVLCAAMSCGVTLNLQESEQSEFTSLLNEWQGPIIDTKAFDVVAVHNYYFPSIITANGITYTSYLQNIINLMKQAGVSDKQIWVTEAGYIAQTTRTDGRTDQSSPSQQATWLSESYQQAYTLGVDRSFWLIVDDRSEPYFGSMGLADKKGNHRPAWSTMQGFLNKGVNQPTAASATKNFKDNGDGTVTDSLTGLMWLKDGNVFGRKSWEESIAVIDDFNAHPRNYEPQGYTAKYKDWRLPDINELEGLVNAQYLDTSAWLNQSGFVNMQPADYWSSTDYRYDCTYAWYVVMENGTLPAAGNKYHTRYVWAVRYAD